MFFAKSLLIASVAGTALASTPAGFEPASDKDLQLAFCDNLAIDGVNIAQEETEMSPAIGTSEQLLGTYAIVLIDTDVPSQTGGEMGTFLHLVQTGLTSSNKTAPIAGIEMFELENKDNVPSLAEFIQPNPPNITPTTHKYTAVLLNTTDDKDIESILKMASRTRQGFNLAEAIKGSQATVVAGNFFTVTNPVAAAAAKIEIRQPISAKEESQRMHIYKKRTQQGGVIISTINAVVPTPQPVAAQPNIIIIRPGLPAQSPNQTHPGQGAAPGGVRQQTTIIIRLTKPAQGQHNATMRTFTTPLVLPDGSGTATGIVTHTAPSADMNLTMTVTTSSAIATSAESTLPIGTGNLGTGTGALPVGTSTGGVPVATGGAAVGFTARRDGSEKWLLVGYAAMVVAALGF